jgi:hypothetical protein
MQDPIPSRMSLADFETLLERSADKLELLEGRKAKRATAARSSTPTAASRG